MDIPAHNAHILRLHSPDGSSETLGVVAVPAPGNEHTTYENLEPGFFQELASSDKETMFLDRDGRAIRLSDGDGLFLSTGTPVRSIGRLMQAGDLGDFEYTRDTVGKHIQMSRAMYMDQMQAIADRVRSRAVVPFCNKNGLSFRCPGGIRFWFTDKDGVSCISDARNPEVKGIDRFSNLLSLLHLDVDSMTWLGSLIQEYDSTTPRRMPNGLSPCPSPDWGTCYVSGRPVPPGTGCTIHIHGGGSILLPPGDTGEDLNPGADMGCWTVSEDCFDKVPMAVRHEPWNTSES